MIHGFDIDGVITEGVTPTPDGVVITGRSYETAPETYHMLHKKGIFNPVYFNPVAYGGTSLENSALWKAEVITRLGISRFYEDDPRQFAIIKANVNAMVELVLYETTDLSHVTKLELGGGNFVRDGYYSLDVMKHTDRTIVHNLEKGLPSSLKDNQIEHIVADNVLEHITNLIELMNDCHRVLKPLGTIDINVPLANKVGSLKDPTHVRQFVLDSFDYFDVAWDYHRQPNYGISKWIVVKKEIVADEYSDYISATLQKPE